MSAPPPLPPPLTLTVPSRQSLAQQDPFSSIRFNYVPVYFVDVRSDRVLNAPSKICGRQPFTWSIFECVVTNDVRLNICILMSDTHLSKTLFC